MTPTAKPRILIVDDDSTLRSTLGRVLRSDYDVTFAAGGAEALQHVHAGETFDIVITDVEMPGMSGRELLERLVERDLTYEGRIVVMTGGPKDPALAAWVDGLPLERVIRKPVGLDGFLAAIQGALDSRDRG